MPTLTVEDLGQYVVPQGKRLVLALEQDAGIDQLHACGGHARCTTCRVEFVSGEKRASLTQAAHAEEGSSCMRHPTLPAYKTVRSVAIELWVKFRTLSTKGGVWGASIRCPMKQAP